MLDKVESFGVTVNVRHYRLPADVMKQAKIQVEQILPQERGVEWRFSKIRVGEAQGDSLTLYLEYERHTVPFRPWKVRGDIKRRWALYSRR